MNFRAIMLMGAFVVLLMHSGCQENPVEPVSTPTSIVTGKVVSDSTGSPIANAVVYDQSKPSILDSTDSNGNFSLSLGVLTSQHNTSIITDAYNLGYSIDTTKISVEVGKNLSVPDIRLKARLGAVIGSGTSGPAASIVLVKQTAKTIALRGTGLNDASILTFKVVDSTGAPVVGVNRCLVKFTLSGGPGAEEYLFPTSLTTNALNGEVSTTVKSGIAPGVLQVVASTRGDTVKASPIFLTAGGGFPDSAHVSIAATKFNIAGRVYSGLSTSISMYVGDRFGNPVADGTSVTFISNGGIIMPSATTKEGVATVDLKSGGGNPPPSGMVTVKAMTTGDRSYRLSDSLITQTMQILFSGPTQYPTSDTVGFTIPDGGEFYFNVTVADDYGNPLVEGSTITVSVKAADSLQKDLELTNNTKTLKDAKYTGTTLRVGVHDKGTVKGAGIVTFGIEVKSENGDYSNSKWFTAYVSGTSTQTGTFNVPAKVELADSSVRTLYLSESNLPLETTKTLTFIVKDALNNPINASKKANVLFSFTQKPSDGTRLNKDQDSTNSYGMVSVQISAGDTAGTARVVAQTLGESGIVQGYSLPILVARGLPDSTRIFLDISKQNMFNKSGSQVGTVSVNLIDKDGNAAAPQDLTASTSGGYVNTPLTTVDGKTTISLYGSSNEPTSGRGNIRVYVPAHGGVTVMRAQPFMFSYAPRILFTNTTIIDSSANVLRDSVADGGSVDVNFAIRDKNGNPISSGNTIKVTASGPAASELELSGDIDVKNLIDTQDPLSANYTFTIKNKPSGTQGAFTITITVTGESGTAVRTLTGYLSPSIAAQKIALASEPTRVLSVRGTGTNETATVTFQVSDLANRAIDGTNPVYVNLSVLDFLGGASIIPTRIQTDANGKVAATLLSGNRYGTFRIQASFSNGSATISSPIEIFTVTGPSPNNFGLQISKNNLPGVGNSNPAIGTATVTVADSMGGSLPTGTRVNFRTLSGGAVASPALTNANGVATTNIKGGFIPNDPVRGMGYGNIQAWMIGDNGDTLKQTVPFLMSGVPRTIYFTNAGGSPTTPLSTPIADGGSANVYFKIRDVNWRPVSNDYAISVAVDGDSGVIEVKNISIIRDIADMDDTTQVCSFQLVDKVKGGGASGTIRVTITVSNKDLGSYSTLITGTLAPAPGAISTRAAEIRFIASVPSPVYVQSTGLPGATTLTFALIDSNNHPVTLVKGDNVQFNIVNSTGQEWLSDSSKFSDANGQVSTTFHTATTSKTFTLRASIPSLNVEGTTDITVLGGYPNDYEFKMSWIPATAAVINVPGMVSMNSELATIEFSVKDQYKNPAMPSEILFTGTTGGYVKESKDSPKGSVTTKNGMASVKLFGDKSKPAGGVGYVLAQTLGDNGTYIHDTLQFISSGDPLIVIDTTMGMMISDGGYVDITFRLEDVNGWPLAGGNKITVTSGPVGIASNSIKLEGDYPNETPNNVVTLPSPTYHLRVSDNVPDGGLSGSFTIKIDVDGPNGYKSKTIVGTLNPATTVAMLPSQLLLSSMSNQIVAAKGTGGVSTSEITFQALDVNGHAIDLTQRDTVFFYLSDIVGGSYLLPAWALTDNNGMAKTKLYAGKKYGTPTVTAKIYTVSSTVTSQPEEVRITGPDINNFSVTLSEKNMPGLSLIGSLVGTVNVQVGDSVGNPVLQGTVITFTTSGGMVTPSNITDQNGSTSASLFGGAKPYEPDLGGDGWGYVTVKTQGDNGSTLQKKAPFLFTGAPIVQLTNVAVTDTVVIYDDGRFDVYYTVSDSLKHPLAKNNTISVTVGGTASSDIEIEHFTPLTTSGSVDSSDVKMQFRLKDKIKGGGVSGYFLVKIMVTGINGTAYKNFTGKLLPANAIEPPSPTLRNPAFIDRIEPKVPIDLNIVGMGSVHSGTIKFQVLDSLRQPIDTSQHVVVDFTLEPDVNSRLTAGTPPIVQPASMVPNVDGYVYAYIGSGTQAGNFRVIAQVRGTSIVNKDGSVRIQAGYADQGHFTIRPARYVLPGFGVSNSMVMSVAVGDTFSNPVLEGTQVYFHSWAGRITTGPNNLRVANTNKEGFAYATLYTDNPEPDAIGTAYNGGILTYDATIVDQNTGLPVGRPGYTWIAAQVQGNEVNVRDSVCVLWNKAPVVITGLPGSITMLTKSVSPSFSFIVKDANGNPLCDGTTISASFKYPEGVQGFAFDVAGDYSVDYPVTIPVSAYARFPRQGITDFTLRVVDNSTATTAGMSVTLRITVTSPLNGNTPVTISVPVSINAVGSISVETAPDGTGATVATQNISADAPPVTVYAIYRDAGGNFVQNLPATWSLINKTGGITNGKLVPSADSKSAVFTGTGSLIGSAQISATFGSLTPVPSGTLTIVAGTPTQISVETAANGSGVIAPAQSVTAGSAITVYSIRRDAYTNFVDNIAATWALINKTGGVANANLVPAGNQMSATLTGDLVGTAQISASFGSLVQVSSNLITIVPGAATQVSVETLADGSGVVVPAQTVTASSSITVYSIRRDAFTNFIDNVAATWSLVNKTGGVADGNLVASVDSKSATFTGALVGTAQVQAVSGALGTVNSGILTVVAGKISVETAADGTGNVISAQNLAAGVPMTAYSIRRDAFGNFVDNIAATWSLINKTGGVVNGNLVPNGDQKSAIFTGGVIGTAKISAAFGGLTEVNSGVLTVVAGTSAQIGVETAANGSGVIVPAQSVVAGNSITVYSIRRDAFGNFIDNATAVWPPVSNGNLVPSGDAKSAVFTGGVVGTSNISATSGALSQMPSGLITVIAGPATQVKVETAADGSGSTVTTQNVSSGIPLKVYSIRRDAYDNFIDNVSATWSMINMTGGVSSGDLVPSGDGKSATFTGSVIGTGQINAAYGILTSVPSGVLTVEAASTTQIRVETAPDGSGTVVSAQPIAAGSSITVYAIQRDASNIFVANVAATWSLINVTGGVINTNIVPSGDGKSATFTGGVIGSAEIMAISGSFTRVPSGTLNVIAGTASQVNVETAADGNGTIVPAQNVSAGIPMTVYSISRDAYTNFVANVSASVWSLSNITGGVVNGDLVPSGDAKSAVFTGAVIGTARINAASGILTPTASGTLNVVAGAPTQVRVETQANGSGVVVPTQTLTAGNSITVYSIWRDASNNFVANAGATWSLINTTGGVIDANLVISGDAKSAVFTGELIGTTQLRASSGTLAPVTSGVVTVVAGTLSVETAADGSGSVVPAQSIAAGSSITVYAIRRDGFNNFVANVPASTWSLSNITGGVVNGDLVPSGDAKSAVFSGAVIGTAIMSVLPND